MVPDFSLSIYDGLFTLAQPRSSASDLLKGKTKRVGLAGGNSPLFDFSFWQCETKIHIPTHG